jgi:hypothetical protein
MLGKGHGKAGEVGLLREKKAGEVAAPAESL